MPSFWALVWARLRTWRFAGEELILDGLAYIERSKLDPHGMKIGRHVAVIGAGNTAMDCATIAKRLGAERVTMIYRRSEREMTAYVHEYEFVKKEGVEFRFLTQPLRVLTDKGKVTGLECVRVELGVQDASRRPAPQPVQGSEFVLEADQVVKAIGQKMTDFGGITATRHRERVYSRERIVGNQRGGNICGRRLHPIERRGVDGDGRAGRKAGGEGDP